MAASAKADREKRCASYKVFKAIDRAYRRGDLDGLLTALGDPADFPDCRIQPISAWVIFRSNMRSTGVRFLSSKRCSITAPIRIIRTAPIFPH